MEPAGLTVKILALIGVLLCAAVAAAYVYVQREYDYYRNIGA